MLNKIAGFHARIIAIFALNSRWRCHSGAVFGHPGREILSVGRRNKICRHIWVHSTSLVSLWSILPSRKKKFLNILDIGGGFEKPDFFSQRATIPVGLKFRFSETFSRKMFRSLFKPRWRRLTWKLAAGQNYHSQLRHNFFALILTCVATQHNAR